MRVGLALSGGAARGLAHVGVLTSLIKAGVPIDMVSGCSAGAVVGAVFCAGMSIELIRHYVPFMSWHRLIRPVRSNRGLLELGRLERWLVMMVGDLYFEDLKLPLALVAMDAYTGELVILRKGRLAPAVRASCSVPGIFAPVKINGRWLVDGGIVDNLPVDAVRELGAEYVIGVDVFEPAYKRSLGPIGFGLTAIETLVRNAGGGVRQADFLIAPKTAGQTYVRFSHHDRLISEGESAANESMSFLLADIKTRSLSSG